jgi:AcrR family transcriptional regulator
MGIARNAGSKRRRSKSERKRTQEERREKAENRILDAATRLIADKGLDAFTIADVGEAAGFSRGLPVHYFKTKDGLLAAVVKRIRQQHFFGILSLKDSERGLEDLFAATALYFQQAMKNPHAAKAFQVFMSGAFYHSNVNKLAAQLNAESLSGIERALSVGKERGHIRSDLDPKIWAIIYLSEIRGVVQQWLVDPKHIALGPIVQEVMTAIQLCVKPV